MNKQLKEDYLKQGSDRSSMRLIFMRTVNVALFIAIIGVIGAIAAPIFDKKSVDLVAVGVLVGTLLAPAFGGKVGQSFSEKKTQPQKMEEIAR